MRVRRLLAAVALACVATGIVVGTAPTARSAAVGRSAAVPDSITIRLLTEPTALQADPRASVYIIDELRPATTITRQVEVTNGTGHATTISLYPSAASIGAGGWSIAPGEARNEVTGWTSISPSSIPLAEGASATATVTISVPADATSGERYEGLVAALPPVADGGSVQLENRVAIRVYLAVDSPNMPLPAPDFTISTLQARRLPGGAPQITATIRNTGGRALDLIGTLQLTDGPGGISAGPYYTDGASTLAVGASGQVSVTLSPMIPAGPWHARIDVRSGLLHRAATGVVTFPASGAAPAVPAHAVPLTRNRHVLIPLVAGLLGLVILGLLFVAWRRRRDDDDEAGGEPDAAPGSAAAAEDLEPASRR